MAYDERTHLPVRSELDDPTSQPFQPRIYVHDQIPLKQRFISPSQQQKNSNSMVLHIAEINMNASGKKCTQVVKTPQTLAGGNYPQHHLSQSYPVVRKILLPMRSPLLRSILFLKWITRDDADFPVLLSSLTNHRIPRICALPLLSSSIQRLI